MTELLSRNVEYSEEHPNGIEDAVIVEEPSNELVPYGENASEVSIDDLLESPAETEASNEQPRQGSALDRAVDRLNQFRTNRAHSAALKENTQREQAAQSEAFASYEENIDVTADREQQEALEDEAYARNEAIDAKDARVEARAERREALKSKVRGFGRAALRFVGAKIDRGLDKIEIASDKVLTVGENAAQKTIEGSKKLGQATRDEFLNAMDATGNAMMAAGRGIEKGMDVVGQKMLDTKEAVKSTIDASKEALRYRREAAIKRKEQAMSRKYERQTRGRQRRAAFKQYRTDVKEGFVDTKDALKKQIRIRRSAGRMALNTYRDAMSAHKQ